MNLSIKPDEYWVKQAENILIQAEKKQLSINRGIQRQFNSIKQALAGEIKTFYSDFGQDGLIDISTVDVPLNRSEIRRFSSVVRGWRQQAVKKGYNQRYLRQLQALQTDSSITPRKVIDNTTRFHLEGLYHEVEERMTDDFSEIYKTAYLHNMYNSHRRRGFVTPFALPSTLAVDRAIKSKWYGQSYVVRVNRHKALLGDEISRNIFRNVSAGKTATATIRDLNVDLGIGSRRIQRLTKSHMGYVVPKAVKDSYRRLEVKEYEFVAVLDDVTTDTCQALDGKVFSLSEARVGENYPPMHSGCRSIAVIKYKQKELEELYANAERTARKPEGKTYLINANTTYSDWVKLAIK